MRTAPGVLRTKPRKIKLTTLKLTYKWITSLWTSKLATNHKRHTRRAKQFHAEKRINISIAENFAHNVADIRNSNNIYDSWKKFMRSGLESSLKTQLTDCIHEIISNREKASMYDVYNIEKSMVSRSSFFKCQ